MMVLLPGNVGAFKKKEVRSEPHRWGWLITPRRSMVQTLGDIPGARWAADNECFTLGDAFNPDRYKRFLERNMHLSDSCLFATAPDVVADAEATLEKFWRWAEIIKKLGFPVALVGQDGLEQLDIPWSSFSALFIGGGTDWKLSAEVRDLIGKAKSRGKWVHVGRVNSQTRLAYCIKLDVDSVDGTEWAINPGRGIKWASRVMKSHERQMSLPLDWSDFTLSPSSRQTG